METNTLIKLFVFDILVSIKHSITKLFQATRDNNFIQPCPRCSSSINAAESQSQSQSQSQSLTPSYSSGDTEWWLKLLAICYAAVQSANQCLQYHQTTSQSNNKSLPAMYYLFCSAIMVAFVSLVLSRYVASSGSNLHRVLVNFGHFFASVSLFSYVTMLFPSSVIFTGWVVFGVAITITVLCYCIPLNGSTQSSSTSADTLPV